MLAFNHIGHLGRLGNQMFQYASLRGIAARRGYDFGIPDSNFSDEWRTHQLFQVFDLVHLPKQNIRYLDGGNAPVASEKHFHFDQEFFDQCPNEVSIFGFFQSEKYFKHIEESIREDFTFRNHIQEPCDEMMEGSTGFDEVLSIYESFKNNGRISNYKTQLKYGNNIIELFPVNPFALSIPSKKFVWIDLFKNVQTIPSNVNVQWDTDLFSEFQIKISADSNFNIELEPLPKHRLLRIEGCIMYLFQKEENQNEVMNIRITIIPNTYDEKLTGDIHINYSQKDYKYNMNTSIEYLKKIKNTLLELNTLKDIVMEDKSINDTEIIEYKKKFGDKLESL